VQFELPIDVQITDNESETKREFLKHIKSNESTLIVSGVSSSRRVAEALSNFAGDVAFRVEQAEDNSLETLSRLTEIVRNGSIRSIIGVGGGKIGDLCKRLSLLENLQFMLVPTVISNDGLISPISVLKQGERSFSLPGNMPQKIVIDLNIVSSAPYTFLRAAACDIISNVSALSDWKKFGSTPNEPFHSFAYLLAQSAADIVLNCKTWNLSDREFQKTVIYGQIYSGLSMAIAGNSRPCSGSEHLICHAMDYRKLGRDILHGDVVGVISQYTLFLQNNKRPDIERYLATLKLPKTLAVLDELSTGELKNLFELAKEMRPGRRTILDQYSNQQLVENYLRYRMEIN